MKLQKTEIVNMKRKIIFRGKTIDNGKWVKGYIYQEIHETYTTYIMPSDLYNGYEYEVPDLCGDDMYRLQFEKYYKVIPESVGQFTGLKDKNGVDIYEGDIVKGKESGYECIRIKGLDYYQIGEVIMCVNTGSWQYTVNNKPHQFLCYLQEVEVIGNIYKNHELSTN